MIIKVSCDNVWHLIDGVEHLEYGNPYEKKAGVYEENMEVKELVSCNQPVTSNCVNAISYDNRNGKRGVVVFNTVAYILNDNGKTIETIYGS